MTTPLNNMISKNILYSVASNHFKGFNSDQQRLPGPVENLNLLWSSDGWHTWDKRYDKTANVASSYFSSKVFKSGLVLRELDRQWNILLICNLNIIWWISKIKFISDNEKILWGANVSMFFSKSQIPKNLVESRVKNKWFGEFL